LRPISLFFICPSASYFITDITFAGDKVPDAMLVCDCRFSIVLPFLFHHIRSGFV
jgi:hypothetical protein